MAARFARTIRDLLVPPPLVPRFDEDIDPSLEKLRDRSAMARTAQKRAPNAAMQLAEPRDEPRRFKGRPPKYDLSTWAVTDDWPDPVPVTLAEVEVFARWFGDILDELFPSAR